MRTANSGLGAIGKDPNPPLTGSLTYSLASLTDRARSIENGSRRTPSLSRAISPFTDSLTDSLTRSLAH